MKEWLYFFARQRRNIIGWLLENCTPFPGEQGEVLWARLVSGVADMDQGSEELAFFF